MSKQYDGNMLTPPVSAGNLLLGDETLEEKKKKEEEFQKNLLIE